MIIERRFDIWGIKEDWESPRCIAQNVAESLATILVNSATKFWGYKNAWLKTV